MAIFRDCRPNSSRYVPKPKPGVFRITKTIHSTLQGVAHPKEKITPEDKEVLTSWIEDNAKRYWLSPGGPLRPPAEGGADVIMVFTLFLLNYSSNLNRLMIRKCQALSR